MANRPIADIGLKVGNIPIRKLTARHWKSERFFLPLLERRAADICDIPFITSSNICNGYSTYYLAAMVCLSIICSLMIHCIS